MTAFVALLGAVLLPGAASATTVSAFQVLKVDQVKAGLDVQVAGPTTGELTVAGGGNLKTKKVPKLIRAVTQVYNGGPATLRLPFTKGAPSLIRRKGQYKLVLAATLVPSDGSAPLRTTKKVILKP